MGKSGDQGLNANQNRTLAESDINGIEVHLFEVFTRAEYTYHGPVSLIDPPYEAEQIGDDKVLRKVWMFPLKVKDDQLIVPEEKIVNYLNKKEKEVKKLTSTELEKRASENGTDEVSRRTTTAISYIRDTYITEFTIKRAKGICQLCDQKAPFNKPDGSPYLECHHIEWLSKGGSDTIENTAALCPNCHKKMHVLDLKTDREKLEKKLLRKI